MEKASSTPINVKCNPDGMMKAFKIFSKGGIIIFPTDTVYGIGCDPFDKNAVRRIYSIKKRIPAKPLPVLTYSKETAKDIACFDVNSEKIVDAMWPGPLTIILNISNEKLKSSLNINDKIALRVPEHECTLNLLKHCKYIVGTSANMSGMHATADPDECKKSMKGYDLLLDGGIIHNGIESTIVEMINDELKIHREGRIKREDILSIL